MADKVVSLSGNKVYERGEVHEGCVEFAEQLLGDAKSGKIHAIGAAIELNGVVHYRVVGSVGFDMIGGLEMAKRELMDLMLE